MGQTGIDAKALTEAGMKALQSNDVATARRCFEDLRAVGAASPQHLFALAFACRRLDDPDGAIAALGDILKTDQYNVRALLMTADCYVEKGDKRAASSYYNLVIQLVPDPERQPPEIAAEIRRAKAAYSQLAVDMVGHLKDTLTAAGYDEKTASRRFTDSVEMLAGTRKRYIEEPGCYFFPDLPQRGFYEREMFDWAADLEAATDDIVAELEGVAGDISQFEPYVHQDPDRPAIKQHRLLDKRDWGALYIWKDGKLVEESARRFPKTVAALEPASLDFAENRAPLALFSRLTPGTRIDPHTGLVNTRLVCHLPLIVPDGCYVRVGNETRKWERGRLQVFNDTIEHEAWNDGPTERVVLLFTIWRPELTEEERRLAAALISSAVSFSGNGA